MANWFKKFFTNQPKNKFKNFIKKGFLYMPAKHMPVKPKEECIFSFNNFRQNVFYKKIK